MSQLYKQLLWRSLVIDSALVFLDSRVNVRRFLMGFKRNFAVTLRARSTAEVLHTMGARSPRGPLPKSGTNLWLAVYRHPLEGAIEFFLDLDISAIFQDIVAIFLPYGRSLWGYKSPSRFGGQPPKTKISFESIVTFFSVNEFFLN